MSGFILPKIVYPSVVVTPMSTVTLLFRPHQQPKNVPGQELEAVRHDNRATSGVQEVVYERTDEFLSFDVQYVALESELADWKAFFANAIQGIPFDYYQDQDINSYVTYFLDDKTKSIKYKSSGQYEVSARFFRRVNWP